MKREKSSNTKATEETINDLMEIRNILFGENIKKIEAQIEALRLSMQEQISSVKDEFAQALATQLTEMSNKTKASFDELERHVEKQFADNAKHITQVASDISEIEQQKEQFEQIYEQENQSFAAELSALDETLSARMEQHFKQLSEQLAQQTQELNASKLDSAKLSDLLIQAGKQLTSKEA